MKRLFFIILAALAPGCASFDDYSYDGYGHDGRTYEGYSHEGLAPASCGCQAPPVSAVSTASGRLPAINQIPSAPTREVQTREPELLGKQ